MAPTNWSDLPKDTVEMIYGKLIDINDSIHFGAVCSSWRRVLVQSQFGKKHLPPQLPLIMYPNYDSLPYHYCVQSIHSDPEPPQVHVHTLSFFVKQYVCLNSSQGWVLVLSLSSSSSDKDDQLYLLNPFLSENNCIQLPPPSQLVDEQERETGEDGQFPFFPTRDLYDVSFISKMVLTDNPLYTSNYTVVLIFSSSDRLAFFRSGSKSWTFIDSKWFDFQDVVYYNDWLYAVTSSGFVVSCDFSHSHTHPIVRLIHDIDAGVAEDDMYDRDDDIMGQIYLVELSGELFCVRRYIEIKEDHDGKILKRTVGFRISKLNPNVPPHQWIELHDLGGHMLFLGGNSSFSVLASDFHICMPNRIFFTDDKSCILKSARIDTGVFNVADASFQWFFSPEKLVHSSFLPLWIQPTMNIKNINKSCSSG